MEDRLYLQSLYTHRELIGAWTMRIIRGRYKQSLLGGLWAIIQPAAAAVIASVIFTLFVPIDTGNVSYLVFSYTAMVPWTLFSGSITDMVDSITGNLNLISKIYFPREVLLIAATLARLLDFAIASSILALLILISRTQVSIVGLLYLPLILATQVALALGLGLAGAALNVFYRDVRHLFVLGLQIWMYATPVLYPTTAVPGWIQPFYFINPMAGVIESYRSVLLDNNLPNFHLALSAIASLLILLTGYWIFRRAEYQFADVI
jgi:lipopolysaccharide transport system permease protein